MSDDKSNKGPQDQQRISLDQDHELRYWTQALGCSEEQLREAVRAVGNTASKVRTYLAGVADGETRV
jgi:hypothetical protein